MATKEEIVQIYIGYYDRAPDATGLAYWEEAAAEWTEEQVAQSFAEQDETKAKYPDSLSTPDFVNTIYMNVFNRDADANGQDYWVKALENGEVTKAEMILAVMNGAQGDDLVTLDNKTEVGTYFADKGQDGYDDAVAALEGVDAEEASVIAAKEDIDALNPLDLTTAKDTLVGFDTDDTFTGAFATAPGDTYSNGDSLDGKEGNDTLNLKSDGAGTDPVATVNNIETINIINTAGAGTATTISAANWSGVESINFTKAATSNVTINDLSIELKDFNVKASASTSTSIATLNVIGDVYQGDDDTAHLTISGTTTTKSIVQFDIASTSGDLVENVHLTSSSNVSNTASSTSLAVTAALDTSDTKYKSITVDGDSDVILKTAATSTKLATVDASALTGSLVYTTTTATGTTVTGGSGNDILKTASTVAPATGAIDTFIGGKGSDTITVDGDGDLIKILYKEDSGVTTSSADIIAGFGTGADHINVVGLSAGSTSNYIGKTNTAVTSIELAVAEANKGDIVGKEFISYTDGADTYLVYDMDKDGTVDGAMVLTGLKGTKASNTLQATDII